jgi:phage FluMu protein Com
MSIRIQVTEAKCPHCGGTNLTYSEEVMRFCRVLGVGSDGQFVIDASWPPNISDEGQEPRIYCNDCNELVADLWDAKPPPEWADGMSDVDLVEVEE